MTRDFNTAILDVRLLIKYYGLLHVFNPILNLTILSFFYIVFTRQYFIAHEQEAGTGSAEAVVTVDELIPQLQVYLGDSGSEARERTRALQLLDQLKGHGLVSAPDSHERISIRPIITHLANPENLTALLHTLKSHAASLRDEGES